MQLIPAWRSRKDLDIVWQALRKLPRDAGHDFKEIVRHILINLSKSALSGSSFYRTAKEYGARLGVVQTGGESGNSAPNFHLGVRSDCSLNSVEKPIIFISACTNPQIPGGWKYSGGIKEYHCLTKLLRAKGYQAYIVTYDGSYEPWLIEHQPCISLAEFLQIAKSHSDIRCVTSWAEAGAFIRECKQLYFWDMELEATDKGHYTLLASLYRRKIRHSAGISCTIQAWHMAHFDLPCKLLPNLVDDAIWFPQPEQRVSQRVGYMDEGPHTVAYLKVIQDFVIAHGLALEFTQLTGPERDILTGMRSCEVFLTMNDGKNDLWGEGGPLPPLEAMATGCVPIAFDLLGPRQIIQSGFSGMIVPRYRPDLMAQVLVDIYRIPGELERLRQNTIALFQSCHTMEARWPFVVDFLDL